MLTNNDLLFNLKTSDYESSDVLLKGTLRSKLIKESENKAYNNLAYTNDLLLRNLNIDENTFKHILFRNYIMSVGYEVGKVMELGEESNKVIGLFNESIKANDFDLANSLYDNNFIVHAILCNTYIKNLLKDEQALAYSVPIEKVNSVYEKLMILDRKNLTSLKKEDVKIKRKISER